MPGRSRRVSLVLGSGGARGLAHIGVIRWLEENEYEIKAISGSSMGALVGGIHALGKLDEFEHWVRAVRKVDLVSLMDVSLAGGGLVRGDKVIDTLREFLGDAAIEELPISFTAVAVNLATEKEVWINSGPLFDAIRASISIPLFFTPAVYKDARVVDGGVLNPVPIAPTFDDDTDLTIAVNLNGRRTDEQDRPARKKEPESPDDEWTRQVRDFISRLSGGAVRPAKRELGFQEIASQSFETMQSAIARSKLASYPPDVLIEISRSAAKMLEFDRAGELIDLGYRRTAAAMEREG